MSNTPFVKISGLKKSYGHGDSYNMVLKGVDLEIEKGSMVVIQGSSGGGKSTMMNCLGGLETFDEGSIVVDGTELAGMKAPALAKYRRDYLGFIFQFYNVIPNLTVKENIQVCEYLSEKPIEMQGLLETLGLVEQQDKFPTQLSGGQQQRCAIARALIKNPKILLCDEPTGALDSKTAKEILILLEKVNEKYGTTIIIITHNNAIKAMMDHVVFLRDGHIAENYHNENPVSAESLEDL